MLHTFENFAYSYWKNGKPYYAPSEQGRSIGHKIKSEIEKKYTFDKFVYHFKDGSHILALHKHRENDYFCRVDIEKFFYSIRRNRIKRILKEYGLSKPEFFSKWSTVKNPFEGGGYVLPYGFIQSPILATLTLATSPIGKFIRSLDDRITSSVYMDDICLSSKDKGAIESAFSGLLVSIDEAGFKLNNEKTRFPAPRIDIFSCSIENGNTEVLPNRIEEFYKKDRTPAGEAAFASYCEIIQSHTWQIGQGKKRRRMASAARRKAEAVAIKATEADTAESRLET